MTVAITVTIGARLRSRYDHSRPAVVCALNGMITNTGIATIATVAMTISKSNSHNFQRPDLPAVSFNVMFWVFCMIRRPGETKWSRNRCCLRPAQLMSIPAQYLSKVPSCSGEIISIPPIGEYTVDYQQIIGHDFSRRAAILVNYSVYKQKSLLSCQITGLRLQGSGGEI